MGSGEDARRARALPAGRPPAAAAAPALRDRSRPGASEVAMGTVGLEPTISSARGWQYTMLTYVPGLRPVRRVIILEPRMRRAPRRGRPQASPPERTGSRDSARGGRAAARARSGHACMGPPAAAWWHPVHGRRVPRVSKAGARQLRPERGGRCAPAACWTDLSGRAGQGAPPPPPPRRHPYDSSFTSNVPSGRLSRMVTNPLGLKKSITPSIVPCHPQT